MSKTNLDQLGFEPRPEILIASHHLSQVQEEHFVDNVYYVGQAVHLTTSVTSIYNGISFSNHFIRHDANILLNMYTEARICFGFMRAAVGIVRVIS